MRIGIDSFAAADRDEKTGTRTSSAERVRNLPEEIKHADALGLDVFGIGEHHREDFADSAPVVILAAAGPHEKTAV